MYRQVPAGLKHDIVNHSKSECLRGDVHTGTTTGATAKHSLPIADLVIQAGIQYKVLTGEPSISPSTSDYPSAP